LYAWLRPVRLQELSLGGNAIGDAGAHHIGNPTLPVVHERLDVIAL
jgi:hypothetical protein